MKKRVLVLGGTGFIGSHVIKSLASRKDEYEVMLLGHMNINFRAYEDLNLITGSLENFDLNWLDVFQPDYIIHMARIRGRNRPGRYIAAKRGARANRRLISHLKKLTKPPHVIYVSGTLVYGDCGEHTVNEDAPLNPTGFAREYILAEKPWMRVVNHQSLPVSILRPPWILGKNSWFKHFHLKYMLQNKSVPVYGGGDNWMSILDVVDCAGLIVTGLEHAHPGKNYNLMVPGYHVQQNQFAHELSALSNLPVKRLDKKEVINTYNKTIYEAFSFSLKSSTKHGDLIQKYRFRFPTINEMLIHNLPQQLPQLSDEQ